MKHKHITMSRAIDRRLVTVVTGALLLVIAGMVAVASGHEQKKDRKRAHDRNRVMYYSDEDRGYLGITMQELTDELIEGMDLRVKKGVLVNEVIEGSPAEDAGFQDGDVIIAFDGKDVESASDLQDFVADVKPGTEVKIKVIRDGRKKTLTAKVSEWPEDQSFSFQVPNLEGHHFDMNRFVENFRPRRLGVRVSELNGDLASYFGVKEGEGLLVLDVVEESTAEDAGVKAGDVIVDINGESVHDIGDIHDQMSELEKGDAVNLTVVRKKDRKELKAEVKTDRGWVESRNFRMPRVPEVRQFHEFHGQHMNDLQKQMEELRKELDELRKELKESKET